MGLDFDLRNFVEDMRACKPPYRCPFSECGKVYKTFSGIHSHINSHPPCVGGSESGGCGRKSPAAPSAPCFRSPLKESVNYLECEQAVEFETPDGAWHKLGVYQVLDVVSKEEWERSLPEAFHKDEATEEPQKPLPPSVKKGKKPKKEEAVIVEQPVDKKPVKLPEASFVEIDDYDIEDAPPMSSAYFRFVEKSAQEQDEEVEYDMDEEDVAWLNIINEKRSAENLSKIHEDQFELLMDRLEKESYFHVQTNGCGSKDFGAPIDEDAICCVCMDGECSNTNVILFCDLCNLAVHQECYGVPYIPEGQWLCRRCLQSPSRSVECCLCPNRGGAFKQTDDGRWAHVVCGLWIPEVRFANTVFLEPIDSIDNIPPARWKLSCRVCKQRGVGACIQCHKTNCYTAFHVTCGLLAGLHMKMDTVREPSAAGLSVTVRKTAYCDVHTPTDSDCKPKLDDVAALGISTPKQKGRPSAAAAAAKNKGSPVPVLFRGLMNFSPQCPWEKVQEIASLINVQRKNQFFQRLMAYWTLKRQTRNGVPLIRRLQFAKATRSDRTPETPQKNAHHKQKKKEEDKELAKRAKVEYSQMVEQRRVLRRLRQDLERVRLLCELIRKREQRKRELVVTMAQINEIKCFPLMHFFRTVLEHLRDIDSQLIFAEPVSLDDVPDYLDHIKHPMDIRTMMEKLDQYKYRSLEDLEADFTLMVDNCLSYNERDTIFFRAGVKMRDQGGTIIRYARRMIDSASFDMDTGLYQPEGKATRIEVSDDKLMKKIDSFVTDEGREGMSLDDQLKTLLELHDQALLLHHPVAKVKRLKLLKQEITKVRRKLSMDKAGTSPGHPSSASKKKSKGREVSPGDPDDSPTGRRLRGIKDPEHAEVPAKCLKMSPSKSPAGVNRRNAVLFTRKKQAVVTIADELIKEEPVKSKNLLSSTDENLANIETEVRSPRKSNEQAVQKHLTLGVESGGGKKEALSFQTYRRGGAIAAETDEETVSESATDALGTSEDSEDGSDASSTNGSTSTTNRMPLEPLDLVWAKCRGYPWYPALIINPKMPRTGYLHNGVPIPVPPQEVLDMTGTHTSPHYLILFFDSKRTWQWLQRDKLEPLGVHSQLDKSKLTQSKKPSEKKAVKKAYEEAILHRCRVTGENDVMSEELIENESEET